MTEEKSRELTRPVLRSATETPPAVTPPPQTRRPERKPARAPLPPVIMIEPDGAPGQLADDPDAAPVPPAAAARRPRPERLPF